jgi:hypothetical protein
MNDIECQRHIEPVSKRLRKLTEANRSLAEIESLDDLLMRLMDLAKEVTSAEASLVFLYHSESRLLEIVSIKDDLFGDHADELFKGSANLKLCCQFSYVSSACTILIILLITSNQFLRYYRLDTGMVTLHGSSLSVLARESEDLARTLVK